MRLGEWGRDRIGGASRMELYKKLDQLGKNMRKSKSLTGTLSDIPLVVVEKEFGQHAKGVARYEYDFEVSGHEEKYGSDSNGLCVITMTRKDKWKGVF